VSAWYSLNASWKGGGAMGGCVSDKTNGQLIFFGHGSMGAIRGRNGITLIGYWTANPNGQTDFTATLAAATPQPGQAPAGKTKTVPEPAPGGGQSFSSPQQLPDDCPTTAFRAPSSVRAGCAVGVTVTSSTGDLKGTTIVAEGEVARLVGELVASCWLLDEPSLEEDEKLTPALALRWCLFVVKEQVGALIRRKPASRSATRTEAAIASTRVGAGGCRARRLAFALRTSKGRVVSAKPVASKLTPSSVRYSCSGSGGTLKIKVDGHVKGGLRKALGTKLDLSVVRSKKASKRPGKLAFAFGW
jgi:hypothetical protein